MGSERAPDLQARRAAAMCQYSPGASFTKLFLDQRVSIVHGFHPSIVDDALALRGTRARWGRAIRCVLRPRRQRECNPGGCTRRAPRGATCASKPWRRKHARGLLPSTVSVVVVAMATLVQPPRVERTGKQRAGLRGERFIRRCGQPHLAASRIRDDREQRAADADGTDDDAQGEERGERHARASVRSEPAAAAATAASAASLGRADLSIVHQGLRPRVQRSRSRARHRYSHSAARGGSPPPPALTQLTIRQSFAN